MLKLELEKVSGEVMHFTAMATPVWGAGRVTVITTVKESTTWCSVRGTQKEPGHCPSGSAYRRKAGEPTPLSGGN